MKLVLYVMNEKKYLEPFLHELKLNHIHGATIMNAKNMMKTFGDSSNTQPIGTFKNALKKSETEACMIMMILNDEFVQKVYEIVNKVSKTLKVKNFGETYLLPISSMKGSKL